MGNQIIQSQGSTIVADLIKLDASLSYQEIVNLFLGYNGSIMDLYNFFYNIHQYKDEVVVKVPAQDGISFISSLNPTTTIVVRSENCENCQVEGSMCEVKFEYLYNGNYYIQTIIISKDNVYATKDEIPCGDISNKADKPVYSESTGESLTIDVDNNYFYRHDGELDELTLLKSEDYTNNSYWYFTFIPSNLFSVLDTDFSGLPTEWVTGANYEIIGVGDLITVNKYE